ncbi:MAG: PIN domain-containing protein [Treponema sp.]|jgi:predicted nucleic acid-binding protein|nr:PIN domain-containing protein [Treponema sp.]
MDYKEGSVTEKIFIDSDIILDVLAEREEFVEGAAELFELSHLNKVELFTTAVVLANVFYMLRKTSGIEKAKKNLQKLRLIIRVLPIDEKIVDLSLNSQFNDFEDGLQYFAAKENNISILITRNGKHYKVDDIIVETAEEYITSKSNGVVQKPSVSEQIPLKTAISQPKGEELPDL